MKNVISNFIDSVKNNLIEGYKTKSIKVSKGKMCN